MPSTTSHHLRRLRLTPLALTTVLLSAGLLSLSVTGALSGFTASITNSMNSAATGVLTMQEQNVNGGTTTTCSSTDGGTASTNTATCTTINKFGGSTTMVPGTPVATTVTIRNTGTVNAGTFTLTPGAACSQTSNGAVNGTATDLCTKMALTVTQNGTQFFSGTLATFFTTGVKSLTAVNAGAASTFVFTVTLDTNAGNTYQGLQAALPMTWTFNS